MTDETEIETREEWAIRFPDGTLSDLSPGRPQPALYLEPGEEVIVRTVTIARTPWVVTQTFVLPPTKGNDA